MFTLYFYRYTGWTWKQTPSSRRSESMNANVVQHDGSLPGSRIYSKYRTEDMLQIWVLRIDSLGQVAQMGRVGS